MSKSTTAYLSSNLDQRQQSLSYEQQALSKLQSESYGAEINSNSSANRFGQLQTTQTALDNEQGIQSRVFSALKHLFQQYSESQGIIVNPSIVLTQTISAQELASTDILKEACKNNYKEGFYLAFDKITYIDFQDSDGKTALMHAIINGFYYGVDKLLQRGADVNIIDNQGANALIYSSQIPHIKYTPQIAARTTDINFKTTTFGDSNALHLLVSSTRKIMFASELNNELQDVNKVFDNLELLIADEDLGNVSTQWSVGTLRYSGAYTVTITSSEMVVSDHPINHEKNFRITDFLIRQRNINIDDQNEQGLTPFFLACAYRLKYLSHKLIDSYQINFKVIDKSGFGPLHWALELRETAILQKILDRGADIDLRDHKGLSTLYWTVSYNLPDILTWLVGHKADVNLASNQGVTPLQQAIINKSLSMVQTLIGLDADVNKPNSEGFLSWHYASICDTLEIMQFLKSKIPNINIKSVGSNQVTALWLASQAGHITIAKWLIAEGADVNTADTKNGCSALHIAAQEKKTAIVELLLHNKAIAATTNSSGIYPLHTAAGYDCLEIVSLLIKHTFVDLRTSEKSQVTALWVAAQNGALAVVKFLLDNGANPDLANADDGTPALYKALPQKHLAVADELVSRGANVTVADNDGRIAIHHCWSLAETDAPLFNKIVARSGATNIPNKHGGYPIHCAVHQNSLAMIKLLLHHTKDTDINQRTHEAEKVTALFLAARDSTVPSRE